MADTRYTVAVGRRKTASARVKITPAGTTKIAVNGKPVDEFFKTAERVSITRDPFGVAEGIGKYEVEAKVQGGGPTAQAEAVRHAISRAIVKATPEHRAALKAAGYLTRDPRAVERKKPGLKKARKAPQWAKR